MSDPNSPTTRNAPAATDPDRLPATEPRYTHEQAREMGMEDSKGHTIQPMNAFMLIALGFIGVAAVGIVVVVVFMRMTE